MSGVARFHQRSFQQDEHCNDIILRPALDGLLDEFLTDYLRVGARA